MKFIKNNPSAPDPGLRSTLNPGDRSGHGQEMSMSLGQARRLVVIGAGAAGVFGALACAEANPDLDIHIFEAGREPLTKVRISGGGAVMSPMPVLTRPCWSPTIPGEAGPAGSLLVGFSPAIRCSGLNSGGWPENRSRWPHVSPPPMIRLPSSTVCWGRRGGWAFTSTRGVR
jgi:hypothetical protein